MNLQEKKVVQKMIYECRPFHEYGWHFKNSGIIISDPVIIISPNTETLLDFPIDPHLYPFFAQRCELKKQMLCRIMIFPVENLIASYEDLGNFLAEDLVKRVENLGFSCGSEIGPEISLPIYNLAKYKTMPFKEIVILHKMYDEMITCVNYCKQPKKIVINAETEECVQPNYGFTFVQKL